MGLCVSDLRDYPLKPTIEKLGLPQEDGEIPKEKRLAYYQATLEHNTYMYLGAAGQSNHAVAVLPQLPADERQEFCRILYANPDYTTKWGAEAHQYFFAEAEKGLNTEEAQALLTEIKRCLAERQSLRTGTPSIASPAPL